MKHIFFWSIGIILLLTGCSSISPLDITTNVEDVDIFAVNINTYATDEKPIQNLGNTGKNKQLETRIHVGEYMISGSKPGYKGSSAYIRIDYSMNSVFLTLKRDSLYSGSKQTTLEQEELKYGYIKLTSNESTVDVYIDGELKGQIPGDDKPFNKKITTGEHTIMVKKQFFSPNSIKVNISENEIIPYHFDLVKATGGNELTATQSNIYQTKGNFTILTERNDLTVYIDGVKKVPPTLLTDIPAGFYTITVKGPNIDDTFKITVKDKETTVLDLDEKYK